MSGDTPDNLPKEAKITSLILQSQGIEDCDPRVVNQLLDFAHRYTVEVFQDALMYSEHAGKNALDIDDVRLSIQGRVNHSFTTPPPKELSLLLITNDVIQFLLELAEERNRTPLPLLTETNGVRLPPEKHCLTAVNFQIAPECDPHTTPPSQTKPMAKTCYYELLGVSADATSDELKKAYRQQALRWHPDKNYHQVEKATEVFAEIRSAYEVLSDPHERAWYDDHKDAILRGANFDPTNPEAMSSGLTSDVLMKYFSTSVYRGFTDAFDGFFVVYGKVFRAVAEEELKLGPRMTDPARVALLQNLDFGQSFTHAKEPITYRGDSRHLYNLVDFYNFWTGFQTQRTFAWHDKYKPSDAPNRYVRRAIEKENRKARETARKEYSEVVKSLALYVKKRDPRMQAWNEEQQEAQRQREVERKKRLDEAKQTRDTAAATYQEPAWAKVDERAYERLYRMTEGEDDYTESDGSDEEASANGNSQDDDSGEALSEAFAQQASLGNHGFGSATNTSKTTPQSTTTATPTNDGSQGSPGCIAEAVGDEDGDDTIEETDPLQCEPCRKRFKSVAQRINHEQSKKHQKAVQQLRAQLLAEDELFG
ncbi:hypothetical protein IWQ60_008295 [Tieghemiomyces parasiticus]|uniref:J domain-containing protein n=1 Tax=Tieghemiomyces parasiticus TaxID=78921 RepID=A0A9W8DSF3_9FUNG|nr:hypothetical protein IWQ60_008295 [Tieghemiomyces parasiticus]